MKGCMGIHKLLLRFCPELIRIQTKRTNAWFVLSSTHIRQSNALCVQSSAELKKHTTTIVFGCPELNLNQRGHKKQHKTHACLSRGKKKDRTSVCGCPEIGGFQTAHKNNVSCPELKS